MEQSNNNNRNESINQKIAEDPNTQQKSHPAQPAPDLKNQNDQLKKEQPLSKNEVADTYRSNPEERDNNDEVK